MGGIGRRETVDCAARNVAGVEERRSRGEVQRRRALDVVDAARGESRVTVRALWWVTRGVGVVVMVGRARIRA